MKTSPLFILSSGRSGSTLLQRVLNTYDNVTIWGEHAGFLAPLADSYYRLLEDHGSKKFLFPGTEGSPIESLAELAERKDPRHWQAWTNFITPDDAANFFRRHVESFFRHPVMGEDHTWGFKEIRYGLNDRVIEFLHGLFPDAIFAFLCRNAFSTLASQGQAFLCASRRDRLWPSRGFLAACRSWRSQNDALHAWHLSGKLRSYWITYEQLCRDPRVLAPLLEALRLEFGPAQKAVFELEEGRGSAFKDTAGFGDRAKTLGYLPMLAAQAVVGEVNGALGYEAPRSLRWFAALRARPQPQLRQADALAKCALAPASPSPRT